MSMPKDQAGLLGALIPNVYIDTITLEHGGHPPEVSNPHIEHDLETNSSFSRDEGTTRMTVDTSIKEIIGDSAISSWFGDKFARYVKLKIVAVTNPFVTTAFSKSNESINILNGAYNQNTNTESMRVLRAAFPNRDPLSELMNHVQVKEYDIYSDAIEDELSLTQHSASVDSDGNIVHDVNFRATFDMVGQPEHISLFAMCYLDMDLLVGDYNLSYDEQTLKGQNGKVASDIVVNLGKVIGISYVFTKQDGKVWSGAVHESADGQWATGDGPSPESVPLKINRVSNDKVQDFRDIDTIQRMPIDLTAIENDVLSAASKKYRYLKNDMKSTLPRNVYFSDLYLARDSRGRARMSFGVDYLRMLSENSTYEKLFSTANSTQKRTLSASCKIRSMRIVRRRVEQTTTKNKLGNPVSGEVVFNKGNTIHTVVTSGETSFGVFNEVESDRGTIRESFYALQDQNFPVRFFTVSDLDVANETDGLYQYGVEMVIEDASQKYIYSLIQQMRAERSRLYEYYLASCKLGMSKFIIELQDPHVDTRWERARIKQGGAGNFSPATGRFTNKFVKEQEAKYAGVESTAPWVQTLQRYFELLNLFTGFSSGSDSLELVDTIQKHVAPKSGSPKGILTVIKMIDNLLSRVSKVVGSDVPLGEGETKLYRKPVVVVTNSEGLEETLSVGRSESGGTPTKTTTVSHWFNNSEFDSNYVRDVGWEYFSPQTPTYNGLRFIPGTEYSQRVSAETLRYFSDDAVAIDIQGVTTQDNTLKTGFGYLAPVGVTMRQVKVDFQAGDISYDQYTAIEAYTSSTNLYGAPVLEPQADPNSSLSGQAQAYQQSLLSQYSLMNMTIVPALSEAPIPLTDRVYSPRTDKPLELTPLPSDTSLDPVSTNIKDGLGVSSTQKINSNSLLAALQVDVRRSNRFFAGSTSTPFGQKTADLVSSGPAGSLSSVLLDVGTINLYNLNTEQNAITQC